MAYSFGSKFVAIIFSFINHTENCSFVGTSIRYMNSWIGPSTKTTKIGTPQKLSHSQYMPFHIDFQKLDIKEKTFNKEQKQPVLTLFWNPEGEKKEPVMQKIKIFTVVSCIIQAGELPLQWLVSVMGLVNILEIK